MTSMPVAMETSYSLKGHRNFFSWQTHLQKLGTIQLHVNRYGGSKRYTVLSIAASSRGMHYLTKNNVTMTTTCRLMSQEASSYTHHITATQISWTSHTICFRLSHHFDKTLIWQQQAPGKILSTQQQGTFRPTAQPLNPCNGGKDH